MKPAARPNASAGPRTRPEYPAAQSDLQIKETEHVET